MPADQGIIDSVANDNAKVIAGASAAYGASLFQSHNAHFSRLNQIAETAIQDGIALGRQLMIGSLGVYNSIQGAIAKTLIELDVSEALGNVAVGQQAMKGAQSTPPETAKPA